jgi:hypothetical protein
MPSSVHAAVVIGRVTYLTRSALSGMTFALIVPALRDPPSATPGT